MIANIMPVNYSCSYEECCTRSMYQGQGQVINIPQYLCDVIICPCPWLLLLAQYSWYTRYHVKYPCRIVKLCLLYFYFQFIVNEAYVFTYIRQVPLLVLLYRSVYDSILTTVPYQFYKMVWKYEAAAITRSPTRRLCLMVQTILLQSWPGLCCRRDTC